MKRGSDPVFLAPLLAPLGGSPTRILEKGGCCSGRAWLFIAALDPIGIRAVQLIVYRRADPAAHCLAQVTVDRENLLIDIDYGVLRRADGAPIDLAGLRSGLVPAIERFVLDREARYANSARTHSAGYPDRDYCRFDYGLTRTANQAGGPLKRAAYAVLHPLTGGRVAYLLLPAILE